MNELLDKINICVNCHSSICINGNIYIDPYQLKETENKAKIIFITHSHYDHLDIESLTKIVDNNTKIVCTQDSYDILKKFGYAKKMIIIVRPNENGEIQNVFYETFSSYNVNKKFHPKENGWVGFRLTIDGIIYTICGDTDVTQELLKLQTDVLFIPIGGVYTMNAEEASEVVNKIMPKLVIPIHYNLIVGNKSDEKVFINKLNKKIKYLIKI